MGISYIKLPAELNDSNKGQINIKNNDQKCFLWSYIRHINPVRIPQKHIDLFNDLSYEGIKFPVLENEFNKIETKNNICINVFCYKNKFTFAIHISDQKCENSMSLLLISDGDKSHCVYIKGFDSFTFDKRKNKNKKYFCKSCLQCLSSENVLGNHKEVCLRINSAQYVKLEKKQLSLKIF